AITDHGNMFGVIEFYKKAIKQGVKPIIGMEAYVTKQLLKDETKSGIKNAYNHLVLLAKNMEGYKNLIKLASLAYEKGFYYRPRIDEEMLEQYSGGILATSACLRGAVPELLLNNKRAEAEDKVKQYLDIFNGDFYIEVMDHGIEEELMVKEPLIELAHDMDVPLIATNDSHYMKKDHALAHEALLCIQTQTTLSDENRFKISTHEIYFKNQQEMEELFPNNPEAIENTLKIADKCNVLFEFGKRNLPKHRIPEEDSDLNADSYLEKLTREGLESKYPEITPELEKRLEYELSIIHKMNFSDYFLVVKDFIKYAKDHSIPVGPGRGSAAGSLISYSLGITNIDPMKYDLLFERFLNPERVSMPDIDIDFCFERREEVIKYVKNTYGDESVTQIITFGTMKARGVVRDVGRVMDVPYDEVDKLAKLIPETLGITLEDALKNTPELAELVNSNSTYRTLFDHALILEGTSRHASTHAAGLVIAPEPLTNFLPLFMNQKTGETTTQYSMNHIEDIGLLKMDILGLRTLTVISDSVKLIRNKDEEFDIENISLDDKQTLDLFSNGLTVGVFQFESSGMRDYLKKLRPECIEDLIAMNALYRPGPLGSNMVDDFIKRKHGEKEIEYMHPKLEPILKETYGIIVYQEQVMRIAGDLAGFTMGNADILRSAMGKKKIDVMREKKSEFIEGCAKNNLSSDLAEELFDHIDHFAGYGFNKSHSAGYAIIAYQTAYLKTHFPWEFMAATMSSEMDSTDRIVILLDECKQMKIPVLPPDIMKSDVKFTVEKKGIRFGLGAIKNVGVAAISSLLKERPNYLKVKNLYEFCEHIDSRTTNKKVMESLIKAGALDCIEGTRARKLESIEKAMNFAQQLITDREKGQTNIFSLDSDDKDSLKGYPDLEIAEEWSRYTTLAYEKEMLGFYLSGHPLDKYRDEINGLSTPESNKIHLLSENSPVLKGGIITAIKVSATKKDPSKSIAFINIEDFNGSTEALLFSDTFADFREMIVEDKMVFIRGKLSKRDEDNPKIIVEEVIPIEQARKKFTKEVHISLVAQGFEPSALDELDDLLSKSKGKCNLIIRIKTSSNENLLMKSTNYQVNPNNKLINQLRELLGRDNVRIAG
ncbi:DNA polymerase III subunit alpha, partial [candidate division KSB1 bacterium]